MFAVVYICTVHRLHSLLTVCSFSLLCWSCLLGLCRAGGWRRGWTSSSGAGRISLASAVPLRCWAYCSLDSSPAACSPWPSPCSSYWQSSPSRCLCLLPLPLPPPPRRRRRAVRVAAMQCLPAPRSLRSVFLSSTSPSGPTWHCSNRSSRPLRASRAAAAEHPTAPTATQHRSRALSGLLPLPRLTAGHDPLPPLQRADSLTKGSVEMLTPQLTHRPAWPRAAALQADGSVVENEAANSHGSRTEGMEQRATKRKAAWRCWLVRRDC